MSGYLLLLDSIWIRPRWGFNRRAFVNLLSEMAWFPHYWVVRFFDSSVPSSKELFRSLIWHGHACGFFWQ